MQGLTSLNLSSNQIRDMSARYLSKMRSLTTLDLSRNRIGDAGTRYISRMWSLITLDLSQNCIGDAGARHISRILDLTSLNLGQVGVQYISNRMAQKHGSLIIRLTTRLPQQPLDQSILSQN